MIKDIILIFLHLNWTTSFTRNMTPPEDVDITFTDPIGVLENGHGYEIASMTTSQTKTNTQAQSSQVISLDQDEDPQNWTAGNKRVCTMVNVSMTATIAFCPSIYTSTITYLSSDFHLSRTVATLGVTTFLLGFAAGPLLFAPLSEVWGRRAVFFATMPLFIVGNVACAVAPNIVVLLVFRFVCGIFGSPSGGYTCR